MNLPVSWSFQRLDQIADLSRGKFSARPRNDPRFFGGDVPFVQTGDVRNAHVYLRDFSQTLNSVGVKVSRVFPRGTMLFTIAANIGDLAFLSFSAACPDSVVAIEPKQGTDERWLFYQLSVLKADFEAAATQNAQLNINLEKLNPFKMPVPPLNEQQAIAAALSDADGVVAGLERLIAKKRLIKQGAMQDLLTARRRLPGFSGEWEVYQISELERRGNVRLGRGRVISKVDIAAAPGHFPIYSSSALNDGLFGNFGRYDFDEELITWSIDGGGYFFHRPKHKFSVTNVCGFLRVIDGSLDYRFLAEALKAARMGMKFDYQDKAHPSVVRGAYRIPIPNLGEQIAVAKIAADMDEEIQTLEARLTKARAVKEGMMQNLLTGRVRLV